MMLNVNASYVSCIPFTPYRLQSIVPFALAYSLEPRLAGKYWIAYVQRSRICGTDFLCDVQTKFIVLKQLI